MTTAYAAPATAATIAERLVATRHAGWTRPALQAETGYTPAQLWRAEQGRAHQHEVDTLTTVLDKIASGELVAPQPAKAEKVDVAAALAGYEAKIVELEARIAALEAK